MKNFRLVSDDHSLSVPFDKENPTPARERLACMRVGYMCPTCKGYRSGCPNRPSAKVVRNA